MIKEKKMSVWLGNLNTTSQSLNNFYSSDSIDKIIPYIKQHFYSVISSIKLFYTLDLRMGIVDNYLIDSGLLRLLFRYRADDRIGRMLEEFTITIGKIAENSKLIYFYDNRINKNLYTNIIQKRFDITVKSKEKGSKFTHSAAFRDEKNWEGIKNYNSLLNEIEEYKLINDFLQELISKIPKKYVEKNPQLPDSFGRILTKYYNTRKKIHIFSNDFTNIMESYFMKFKGNFSKMNRSNFDIHLSEKYKGKDPKDITIIKRLFSDKVYNLIIPEEATNKKNYYNFETWYDFNIPNIENINNIYQMPIGKPKNLVFSDFPLSAKGLYMKNEIFRFIGTINIDRIEKMRKDIHESHLGEHFDKEKGKILKSVLWAFYLRKYKKFDNSFPKFNLNILKPLVEFIGKIYAGDQFEVLIPKILNYSGIFHTFRFYSFIKFNKEWKELRKIIDYALSGGEK